MLSHTFLGLALKFRQDRGVVVLPQQLDQFIFRERQHLAVVEGDYIQPPQLVEDASR